MTALHVVVQPRPQNAPSPALARLHGALDILIDGVNVTARVGEGQALDFLMDLAFSFAQVVTGPRRRTQVPLQGGAEAWELGLEADGDHVLVSVYCPGPVPSVAAHGRRVAIATLREAMLSALEQAASGAPNLPPPVRAGLKGAKASLLSLDDIATRARLPREVITVRSSAGGVTLSAELEVAKLVARAPVESSRLERTDLHALLSDGKLVIADAQRQLVTGKSQVFLDCERLLALARCAVESFRSAQPTFRRTQLDGARVSLRRGGGDSMLELAFHAAGGDPSAVRMHRLGAPQFVRLVASFALSLCKKIKQHEPDQRFNLRLKDADEQATRLLEQLDEHGSDESVTNPSPDTYRRFVPRVRRAVGMWETGPKMRFAPRWVAAVPELDLRATFLCGDQFVVGAAHETACLRRSTGEVLWRKPTHAAACVVSPAGLVRIEPDGLLSCHELGDGEVRFSMRVLPRSTRAAAGSVLHGPGLPDLLALVEGDRQVTAIDLKHGSVRWRHSMRRPGTYKLRRAGRLLLIAGGDPLMVAVDAVSGEAVWSLRARLPFSGEVAVDHDSAFTISGSLGGRYHLHRFNPFSGHSDWEIELDERPMPGRAPLLTPEAVIIPTLEVEGCGVLAFCRKTGTKLWEYAPGLVSATSAWLAVDDCVLSNSSNGVLIGLSARDGQVRFNHVFCSSADAEQPRRLEPVLRSGALFVPQEKVHVLRPRDGELLGTLPSDLIPDLIRVDERCDVYLAEESGHIASFGAAPRLALVR
jgi:outer membrane protein assembly factor BamB